MGAEVFIPSCLTLSLGFVLQVCSVALAGSCYGCVVECSLFLSLCIGAGLPLNSSAGVYLNWKGSSICAQLTLHAGASGPTATLEQSSHHISQTTGCSQVRVSQSFSNCESLKGSHSSQISNTPANTLEQMQYLCSFFSYLFLFYVNKLSELPGCMQTKKLLCINEFTRFELTKVKNL